MKRYSFMDLLRVLSFITIIVYHYLKDLAMRGLTCIPDPDLWMQIGNVHLCMVAVGLFFMLSGAGLTLKMNASEQKDWKAYYIGRFRSVMIPFYIVWIIYTAAKLIWTGGSCFSGIAPWRLIFSAAGLDEYLRMTGVPTFSLGIGEWFLGALILMYAIYPVLYNFLKKNRWVTIGAFTAYYLLIVLLYQSDIPWHMNAFVKIYEFVLGMFLAEELPEIEKRPWLLLLIGGIFLPVHAAFINTIACAGIFILGIILERYLCKADWFCRILKTIGAFSFEIYLVHHAVIYAVDARLAGQVILGRKQTLLLFLVELLIMILAAIVVKKLSELAVTRLRLYPEKHVRKDDNPKKKKTN